MLREAKLLDERFYQVQWWVDLRKKNKVQSILLVPMAPARCRRSCSRRAGAVGRGSGEDAMRGGTEAGLRVDEERAPSLRSRCLVSWRRATMSTRGTTGRGGGRLVEAAMVRYGGRGGRGGRDG